MSENKEVEYPRYLMEIGDAEPEFVSAEEAKGLLGAERSDVTFGGRVQVSADYIVSMSYGDVVKELKIVDLQDAGQ